MRLRQRRKPHSSENYSSTELKEPWLPKAFLVDEVDEVDDQGLELRILFLRNAVSVEKKGVDIV